ncbi:hypothetical protein [Flavobacterium branchiicola]|uniref:Uncharacterized protein n=1 Tax=Flavobacterium branchiicola TaxID=1114875 RepID=A0ABV9PJQ6_9FLAO|nr:hypothetical protein [Flavobacterium branchiicola]MBS7256717.1 hypothetical protein [Flavobacterium branchiicola]
MKFKIVIPARYHVKNYYNDNLDVNVILENKEIFFATIFTLDNIKMLLELNKSNFFWADTMIIIKDLKKETIKEFVKEVIDDGNLESIFYKIGNLGEIEGYPINFESVTDFIHQI